MVELVEELVRGAGYPGTSVLRAFHSLGSLLLAKCARQPRARHVEALAADPGLGLLLGLTALPKATHLTSYDQPPELDLGDRVIAVHHLGGLLRPTVRRGTHGVVIARTPQEHCGVRFSTGRTLDVHPEDLMLPDVTDLEP